MVTADCALVVCNIISFMGKYQRFGKHILPLSSGSIHNLTQEVFFRNVGTDIQELIVFGFTLYKRALTDVRMSKKCQPVVETP